MGKKPLAHVRGHSCHRDHLSLVAEVARLGPCGRQKCGQSRDLACAVVKRDATAAAVAATAATPYLRPLNTPG